MGTFGNCFQLLSLYCAATLHLATCNFIGLQLGLAILYCVATSSRQKKTLSRPLVAKHPGLAEEPLRTIVA